MMKTVSQTLICCSVLIMHEPQSTARREKGRRSEDLVGGGQLGPRLVCPAIVVLSLGDLHVLVEAQDLSGLKFSDGGSLTQLQKKQLFLSVSDATATEPAICCGCAPSPSSSAGA